ncbi:uncharacterized protein G2W53_031229 [Senna tora]|uniref:Uncharacterized protein n=1 Tax=Senna tora TaxID=362788 RepID=A0A834T8W8_9FABA|nr:uncharacterized protein G2W53_031229 [Senna tora]
MAVASERQGKHHYRFFFLFKCFSIGAQIQPIKGFRGLIVEGPALSSNGIKKHYRAPSTVADGADAIWLRRVSDLTA